MSVRMISRVWDYSTQKGNDLLMLLAIADFADDDGNAYPSVQTLATKCRMLQRNANKILANLRESGELEIRQNEGPHGTNRYRVVLDALTLSKRTGAVQTDTLSKRTVTPVHLDPKPLSKRTDEPSLTVKEPSTRADDGFLTFWNAYPKKVSKAAAEKAWKKAKADLQTVLNAIERAKVSADWQKDGGQFIPYPASWLNGRRWEDEIAVHPPSAPVAGQKPKAGDTRARHGITETFDEVAGWVPA